MRIDAFLRADLVERALRAAFGIGHGEFARSARGSRG